MPTDGSATIVNLLSITSKLGAGRLSTDSSPPRLPPTAAYAASTAALQNLTATTPHELSSLRIPLNGVAAGLLARTMTDSVPDRDQRSNLIPMNRFGTTDEVVDAIGFLVSQKASYIRGASIELNGAWHTC